MTRLNLAPNECSCETCQRMCRRPCWGTPEDAKKLIDAGYGHRLMLDYWGDREDGAESNTFILCPALKGSEGKKAPFFPRSPEGCTFWKNGLCELHDLGLKPTEGKLATCKPDDLVEGEVDVHEELYLTWKNPEAQKFATEFIIETNDHDDDPILQILDLLQSMKDCLRDIDEN